jgi:hypothetical protein
MKRSVAVIFAIVAIVLMGLSVAVAYMLGNAVRPPIWLCALIGALHALPTTQFVVTMLEDDER